MQPDLPETYYLDNVLTLFAHVERIYADILEPAQLEFLEDFAGLGEDAKKLCIRLLNRSGEWFRRDKLNYREIACMDAALDELVRKAFIELDGEIEYPALLSLFTKPELFDRVADKSGLAKLRRNELDAFLLQQDDAQYFRALAASGSLIRILRQDQYQICQMLFFGNLNQSMTDFVLRDLGLYQYERYNIDHDHRPYRSTLEIQQHWLLYQLEARFELCDSSDRSQLDEIARLIPDDIAPRAPAYRKSERLRYEIARQLERIGDPQAALALYRQCRQPPSRERIARIHDQLDQQRQALDDCIQIIEQPIDEQEIQFACMFAARLIRRHGFAPLPAVERQRITHQPEIVELELEYRDSVELAVAEYYNAVDAADSCFYLENSLFNGVLGLLIWEVVFAPLPGAFYNPFQYRPSDFYRPDFCAVRRDLLARTWASIDSNDDIWRIVSRRWQQKLGVMNPLVNWQNLDLDIVERALERIGFADWRAIFDRILNDLRGNRAGFPDLVHFPAAGGYCLIEVKGPGDSLQQNQQRWMQYFRDHDIPHRLARVAWHCS